MSLEFINSNAEYALWTTRIPKHNNFYEEDITFFLQVLKNKKKENGNHLDTLILKCIDSGLFVAEPNKENITTIKNNIPYSKLIPANDSLITSFLILYEVYSKMTTKAF
ncbi:MAG: hypothetical protein QXI33_01560 [Candidatus Pacearchaeota archaeon]